jgi:hypothetical protein
VAPLNLKKCSKFIPWKSNTSESQYDISPTEIEMRFTLNIGPIARCINFFFLNLTSHFGNAGGKIIPIGVKAGTSARIPSNDPFKIIREILYSSL